MCRVPHALFTCIVICEVAVVTSVLAQSNDAVAQRAEPQPATTESNDNALFPPELTRFTPIENNPVFTAGGDGRWDVMIRERGWIMKSGDVWRMWYTGYDGTRPGQKMLGYATSTDGVRWTPHPDNPIYDEHWIEDMMVVEKDGVFYLFAEGEGDASTLFTSPDGIQWTRVGPLDVRKANGEPIEPGPYGTPTAWFEDGVWCLFYERYDKGIWLATSKDMKVWTNVSDEPVLSPGPDSYDGAMIALNQIVKHNGRYYAYYHGRGDAAPFDKWCSGVATSDDLRNWVKYPNNPLQPVAENKSSGIVVYDGERFRFYTMHGKVDLHLPVHE